MGQTIFTCLCHFQLISKKVRHEDSNSRLLFLPPLPAQPIGVLHCFCAVFPVLDVLFFIQFAEAGSFYSFWFSLVWFLFPFLLFHIVVYFSKRERTFLKHNEIFSFSVKFFPNWWTFFKIQWTFFKFSELFFKFDELFSFSVKFFTNWWTLFKIQWTFFGNNWIFLKKIRWHFVQIW